MNGACSLFVIHKREREEERERERQKRNRLCIYEYDERNEAKMYLGWVTTKKRRE